MKKTRARKRKGLLSGGLAKIAVIAFIAFFLVVVISTETECSKKEEELKLIKQKISLLEAENTEISRILNNPDISPYMEKVAIEEQGYAYHDEIRFYDTSRY